MYSHSNFKILQIIIFIVPFSSFFQTMDYISIPLLKTYLYFDHLFSPSLLLIIISNHIFQNKQSNEVIKKLMIIENTQLLFTGIDNIPFIIPRYLNNVLKVSLQRLRWRSNSILCTKTIPSTMKSCLLNKNHLTLTIRQYGSNREDYYPVFTWKIQ